MSSRPDFSSSLPLPLRRFVPALAVWGASALLWTIVSVETLISPLRSNAPAFRFARTSAYLTASTTILVSLAALMLAVIVCWTMLRWLEVRASLPQVLGTLYPALWSFAAYALAAAVAIRFVPEISLDLARQTAQEYERMVMSQEPLHSVLAAKYVVLGVAVVLVGRTLHRETGCSWSEAALGVAAALAFLFTANNLLSLALSGITL